MKHLENYGVQALSTEELKSTDGGGLLGLLVKGAKYVWKHRKTIGAFIAGEAASEGLDACQQ